MRPVGKILPIVLCSIVFHLPCYSQLEWPDLDDFTWSGWISARGDNVSEKTKPFDGYVILTNDSIIQDNIRLTKLNDELDLIEVRRSKKWRKVPLEDVVTFGLRKKPQQYMVQGRRIHPDSTKNFLPLRLMNIDDSGENGFGNVIELPSGSLVIQFSPLLNQKVRIFKLNERETLVEGLWDADMYQQLYSMGANTKIKYGIITGNTTQIAFDGQNRKGLRVKAIQTPYENAEHHLYEASRSIHNGNNGYAAFMLGKGIFEYVVPPLADETVVSPDQIFVKRNRQRDSEGLKGSGAFVIQWLSGMDYSGYRPEDFWTLVDYLNTYALFVQSRGRFAMARDLYEFGLEIAREKLNLRSEVALAIRHNYALLQTEIGNFNEAINTIDEVLMDLEFFKGKNSSPYCIALNNKAMLMARLGQLSDAQDLIQDAKNIATTAIPGYSIDSERILINDAMLSSQLGEKEIAERTYIEALEIITKKERTALPDYDQTLLLQGRLYLDIYRQRGGEGNNLLTFIASIKQKIEEKYKDRHSFYGHALVLEAEYHLHEKQYSKALDLLREANNVQLTSKGNRSYDYLKSRSLIGLCEWKLGNVSQAQDIMKEVASIYLDLKSDLFSTMSEGQREQFWQNVKPHIDVYTLFAADNSEHYPEWIVDALNFRIATKGLLFSTSAQLRKTILESGNDELMNKLQDWISMREDLLNMYNLDKKDRSNNDPKVKDLENEIEKYERDLAQAMKLPALTTSVTFDDIKSNLSRNHVLVEIARIGKNEHYLDSSIYLAFIVKPNFSQPEVVRLESARLLEGDYYKNYINAVNYQLEDTWSFNNYWGSVSNKIAGAEQVFVTNDGIYNQININGLLTPTGEYVGEIRKILYLTSVKDFGNVLKSLSENDPQTDLAYLVGNPRFGSRRITPLPGTEVEIATINDLLSEQGIGTTVYREDDASELKLRETQGVGILHVATHGYFLEEKESDQVLPSIMDRADFRSGLILAEAQSGRPEYFSSNDGFFSAYEALHLDLVGTKLVVLSACETGRGELMAGESIQGLARAFQVAGSEAVIMSLWKVSDNATQELMTNFYKNWLSGSDYNTAFYDAQNQIKEKYPHPYYWSAFVLLN